MATTDSGVETELAALTRVLRAMFPHPSFPDGPFERSAAAIMETVASDPMARGRLEQGLVDLDTRAGDSTFAQLDDAARLEVLRGMQGTPFFEAVRAKAILTLYNDSEVWELLGYEGASYEQGGYLDRGFDDLDWLPEPSLGEVTG